MTEQEVKSEKQKGVVMTDDLWEELENELGIFRPQKLLIDGYNISLQLKRTEGLKLGIMVYVDGVFKHKWLHEEENEIRQRFYWKRSRYKCTKEYRDIYVENFGKREAKKKGYFDRYNYWWPWFESFQTLKRTFKRNNDSIKWLRKDN